jgi:hypothetical protein
LFGTTSDPSPPPLMFWWQIPQQAYSNTISDALPSTILLHTYWQIMAPEFCSFAFWSNISFLVPQHLGPSNSWCKDQYHLHRTFVQQHSQTQTEEITNSCFWKPTCYWMRHSLFYSFYYSRTRQLPMSRHMMQSQCVSCHQLLLCFFMGVHI